MAAVEWEGEAYVSGPGETVLDTLLRHGVAVPHSCRAGVCQSCLLQACDGPVPPTAQIGLKDSFVEQGYFLSCVCRPEGRLRVARAGAGVRVAARLAEIGRLSETVLRVIVETEAPLEHRAGQYLTLFRADGLARSYSIASLPQEGRLELHVRVVPDGQMSMWLAEAPQGASVSVQGPAGQCFYVAGAADQPLLLAGAGTGLAPLYGIARDALQQGHAAPIWLYHGALHERGLYLVDELKRLQAEYPNFYYRPALLEKDGPLPELIASAHPQLAGWRGFVCGDPQIVHQLRRRMFLCGMASRHISSDAFVTAAR